MKIWGVCVKFLFQTGAIKRKRNRGGRRKSYLVFLFQTGAIKRDMFTTKCRLDRPRFYSKLVRLKVTLGDLIDVVIPGFLFQTGAIKSRFFDMQGGIKVCVSIPNWCD